MGCSGLNKPTRMRGSGASTGSGTATGSPLVSAASLVIVTGTSISPPSTRCPPAISARRKSYEPAFAGVRTLNVKNSVCPGATVPDAIFTTSRADNQLSCKKFPLPSGERGRVRGVAAITANATSAYPMPRSIHVVSPTFLNPNRIKIFSPPIASIFRCDRARSRALCCKPMSLRGGEADEAIPSF